MLQSIDKTFELKLQASNVAPAGSEFQLSAPSTTFQTFLGTSSVRLGSLDLEHPQVCLRASTLPLYYGLY